MKLFSNFYSARLFVGAMRDPLCKNKAYHVLKCYKLNLSPHISVLQGEIPLLEI